MSDPTQVLKQWAQDQVLKDATLQNGKLTLNEITLDATQKVMIENMGKKCEYTLASIFLQILDPSQGLVSYRNACKKHSVQDPIKALEKKAIVGFFINEELAEATTASGTALAAAAPAEQPTESVPPPPLPPRENEEEADADATMTNNQKQQQQQKPVLKTEPDSTQDGGHYHKSASSSSHDHHHHQQQQHRKDSERKHHKRDRHKSSSSSKHRDHHHHHHHKRRHSSSDPRRDDKKKSRKMQVPTPKSGMIDPEKLFSNLNVVVDKRGEAQKEMNQQLQKALSAEGFDVTPEMLSKSKESAESLMAFEIPVGNSKSILQAHAGRDLSRILKLYMDTVNAKSSSSNDRNNNKSSSSNNNTAGGGVGGSGSLGAARPHLIGQKPIIVLPKGMTAPITMANAHEFFANAKFVPRDIMLKQQRQTKKVAPNNFERKVSARLGGGKVTYELMDNPRNKLRSSKDWDRVVAVIALGASWQFKDWPPTFNDPVHLFGKTFGFFIGMEGAKLPTELTGWAVKQATLNRDKRGLDSVTFASFWNGLDEWMAIHKPEMLPQDEV